MDTELGKLIVDVVKQAEKAARYSKKAVESANEAKNLLAKIKDKLKSK